MVDVKEQEHQPTTSDIRRQTTRPNQESRD